MAKVREKELDAIADECRKLLKENQSRSNNNDIYELLDNNSPWYQRIELPKYQLTTTSNNSWAVFDQAPDNTLGGRLSPKEAAILRPQPKWMFIQKRWPETKNKTVLEVGSNCGFFSFQFAKLGAKKVTGFEPVSEYFRQASLLKDLLGFGNVEFIKQDFLSSGSQPAKYDIVFSSSVVGHMIFPFLGLYRMLEVAKEFMVLDIDSLADPSSVCRLETSNQNQYHFFNFSGEMLTKFFYRCGIKEKEIARYLYADRCLYIVDVSSAKINFSLDSNNDPLWSSYKKRKALE